MRGVIQEIRKAIYTELNGNINLGSDNVPVYNKVPSTTTYPFIKIYSDEENTINDNSSNFIKQSITKIEVVSRFRGNVGGSYQSESLVDEIIESLKGLPSITITTAASWASTYITKIEQITYLEERLKDYTYYRGIITISCQTEIV